MAIQQETNGLRELALFAGAGGGILGGKLLGWRTVCAVEWDAYAASVLVARQNDGCLPPFPIWDDVQTFDGRPWRGRVDVISGGFPCQDISAAGKGAGIDGERSGMWGHMARIVGEVLPQYVFVENSPLLVGRGLTRVLGDLAKMGYDAKWGIVGAHHVAAPHKRDRCWVLGYTNNNGFTTPEVTGSLAAQGNIGASGENQTSKPQGSSQQPSFVAHAKELPRDGSENNTRNLSQSKTISKSRNDGRESDVANPTGKRGRSRDTKRQDAEDFGQLQRGARGDGEGVGWWDVEPNVGRVANGVASLVDRLKAIGNGQVPQAMALAWKTLTRHD